MPTWVMWLTLVNLALLVLLVLLLIVVIILLLWRSTGAQTSSPMSVSFGSTSGLSERVATLESYLGSNRGGRATWTGLVGNITKNNEDLRQMLEQISSRISLREARAAEVDIYLQPPQFAPGVPAPVPPAPGGPGVVPSSPPTYPP